MPSLVLESTWANAGGTVIIYLAALTGVNRELYEAASVDGASLWRKVWHITLPQLRGVLLVTMILQIIGTAQVFLEPYLFTSGGPANSTLTVLLLIYNYAFGNSLGGDYGSATALSLMLAAFLARLLARLPARDALVEHAMIVPGAAATQPPMPRAVRARSRRTSGAAPRIRWGVGGAQALLLVGLVVVGLGPDPLAGEVGDHADDRHDQPSDVAVPARRGLEQPARGLVERPRRPLLLEHGRARDRLVARADPRRDHRRASRSRCCGRSTRGSSPASCSRRSSSPRSCCSCRSTSRSCTRR